MGMYCHLLAVDPAEVDRLDVSGGVQRGSAGSISLEKAWHGLHYLLTGEAWGGEGPLNFLLLGGEPVGDDMGYGPARLLRPAQVRELHAALEPITDDALWARFDAEAMDEAGIYPQVWDEPEGDLRDEYTTYFRELKELVRQASADGAGLLIVVN